MEDVRCVPESSINFQKYCTNVIAEVSELDENVKNKVYEKTVSHEERFQILFDLIKTTPVALLTDGKHLKRAQDAKLLGNKLFADKKYDVAIKTYNLGIISCPQNNNDEKELLTILVSNRSAAFFEKKIYQNVIQDCDYVIKIGHYPLNLHHKLWLRKAKSYDALDNEKCAKISYDLALSTLKNSNFSEKELSKKVSEIEKLLQKPKKRAVPLVPPETPSLSAGTKYTAVHKNIKFDYEPELGRYAKATTNIETGTIIAEELPHCSVVTHQNSLTNCQYCCMSTQKPIACARCDAIIFCSLDCQDKAKYHVRECRILPILKQLDISVNCTMALRMITQNSCEYFWKNKEAINKLLNAERGNESYKSDEYLTAIALCRNEDRMSVKDMIHYSIMTTFLLHLLKNSNYFGECNEMLSEQELFIGRLILNHLLILQFNSHEISELGNTMVSDQISYKNNSIGAGLYPTLALFNHSCDPTIARYNIGNRLVYRTIKPVKPDQVIYENYGAFWTTMELEERQKYLNERYCFSCKCLPCQKKWPLLDNLDVTRMTIACQTKTCPMEFVLSDDNGDPFQNCQLCRKVTNFMPILNKLAKLMNLTPQAEELYSNGAIMEAIKIYTQILEILYDCLKPPHPDMVNAQQRLKTLFLHLGNKQVNYQQKL